MLDLATSTNQATTVAVTSATTNVLGPKGPNRAERRKAAKLDRCDRSAVAKDELFGTMLRLCIRWTCACGAANVTRVLPPVRAAEHVYCRRCHGLRTMLFDLAKMPRFLGGTQEAA